MEGMLQNDRDMLACKYVELDYKKENAAQ